MRSVTAIFFVVFLALASAAQKPDDVLATATGHTFRIRDLSPETQKLIAEAPANYAKMRTDLFDQFVTMRLLQAEAAARNATSSQVILAERAKVKEPTEAEIKTVYDQNRAQIGGQTLEQVRKQIVDYLRYEHLMKALDAQLKAKFKFAAGKEVNTAGLQPADAIATINGKPVTDKEFETFAAFDLYALGDGVASAVLVELDGKVRNAIQEDEAKALGIDSSTLIAREITNKMKDFSDGEREQLENAFYDRLYTKYQVKTFYKKLAPLVEDVSAGNGPSTGPTDAPVTVIMFSDFQCSACSAVHPMLKEAMAGYPGKIRFVVRYFPLETVHDHSYRAALAGYAAHQQGKFFEYTDLLYKNQSALDDASLKKYASDTGLNVRQFALDFMSEKAAAAVKQDIFEGENYGIHSTPTIFINGVRARNYSVEGFRAAIERALRK
jgi:protein-disulfide isomerase